MANIDQSKRILQLSVPFDENSLLINVEGKENFSSLFNFNCEIISNKLNLDPQDIIGQTLTATCMHKVNDELKPIRYINGIIQEVTSADLVNYTASQSTLSMRRYYLRVVPKLYLLTKTKHSRVFQKKQQTVVDIVSEICKFYGIEFDKKNINNNYTKEYCLQYNESDYDFINRILSEVGIFYYFHHTDGQHTLILADKTDAYLQNPKIDLLHQNDTESFNAITQFSINTKLTGGKYVTNDYSLIQPSKDLTNQLDVKGPVKQPSTQKNLVSFVNSQKLKTTEEGRNILEGYAGYQESIMQHINAQLGQLLQIAQVVNLKGNYFSKQKPNSIVVTSINFTINDYQGLVESDASTKGSQCYSIFTGIDSTLVSRPEKSLSTIKPGAQLAHVVNANGEMNASQPLYYDELGRVCVKFSWENYPGQNLNGNTYDQCLVSALHHWDNGIYRVGTTVIVDFINNDPDRPIIIGAINDADHLLLGKYTNSNEMQSIIQRIPGVDANKYNNIMFDDKQEKEMLAITAINELTSTSKKESFSTEEHLHKIKNSYELQADSEKYKSNKLERTVDGKYELTANDIVIKGNVTINGNLKTSGSVNIE